MIRHFGHKGLEAFFRRGSKAGIRPDHAARLQLQLAALDHAKRPNDLSAPSWKLHPLKGDLDGRWSVTVSGNWRMTFEFRDGNAYVVDYEDYH